MVSSQYWSGSPENHKAAELAFNVGPSSARQRNAIYMAFRWRADDGPLLVLFGSSFPISKKTFEPLLQNFLDPRMHSIFYTTAVEHRGGSQQGKYYTACSGNYYSTGAPLMHYL